MPSKIENDSKQPAPTPPVSARPTKLSITEIETWIRDPYAIYAKHILELRALPPIIREADPALRGTIYHKILADFIETWPGRIDDNAGTILAEIADEEFTSNNLPIEVLAAWRPRFTPVGEKFLEWQSERWDHIKTSHCEISLNSEIGDTGFILHGRADRIDVNADGELSIIDYKTGNNPTKEQARTLSPQLSLEAVLATRGKTGKFDPAPVSELLYVRIKAGKDFKSDDITIGRSRKKPEITANELVEKAYNHLINHIVAYQSEIQPYLSQYAPQPNKSFVGDYDYLARIREWSLLTTDDGEGAE